MSLSVKPPIYALPSYSLTGDLVGFLRCGLQYRYTRIGQLPSSQPVQMWFGEFIHGVLEESYRRFHDKEKKKERSLPPWSPDEIEDILRVIKRRLAAKRLFPWSEELERTGESRAAAAINELGPELFPIIHRAEVRLRGARKLPVELIPSSYRFREADRYEMVGVVDVVTHIELGEPSLKSNKLLRLIREALPGKLPPQFEVIIDYKGMRRPSHVPSGTGPSFWDVYGWQLQTYAHLRSLQPDSLPVVAGIILYINELQPAQNDLLLLREEIIGKKTDVAPDKGSEIENLLMGWTEKHKKRPKGIKVPLPVLPFDFRLQRALRVVQVTPETIRKSLKEFDGVVARIETCRGKELSSTKILSTWEKNAADEDTCKACDTRTFCPDYKGEGLPQLPGVRG